MIEVIVKGLDKVLRENEKDAKQMRFAGAVALTKTAQAAQHATGEEIKRAFSRPTAFTVKSVFIGPAKKDNLESRVGIKPIASQYLTHHVEKTDRNIKRAEAFLHSRGLLPRDMFVVPGRGVRLNKSGNITRRTIKKILDGVTKKGGVYFQAEINSTQGIWQRKGARRRGVKPILIFIHKPRYRPRFDFYRLTEKVFNKRFAIEFDAASETARRTAR